MCKLRQNKHFKDIKFPINLITIKKILVVKINLTHAQPS